ncbi:MAG: peptidyl-prolyl cis-trans isomerase, partial [Deltaproteobacteria bacterium]
MNLTEEEVKSRLARDIATKQFIDEQFAKHVEVSDKEIKDYYESNPDAFKAPEQVRASHILIKVEPQADEAKKAESRKKLEMIQQRVKKGEDFAALAREFSEGPSSTKGGDLGYFRRGQMVKPFEDAAFGLKPGEVSDIVETRFGYHLIKVVDKKPETTIGYEEVKERIEAFLKQRKTQNQINLYVENLKKDAKVEIFLGEEGK